MFSNYQNAKVFINNPEYVNTIIILFCIFCALISIKKRKQYSSFDRVTTGQLRGIAILMVVVGHLWGHVSQTAPSLVLSRDGVGIFLLLSGFGITRSLMVNNIGFAEFICKRINKVMIPYWVTTLLILFFDYFLLNESHKLSHILISLLGINVYGIMHHFDYVRWYITFLLFWYFIVFISYSCLRNFIVPFLLLVVGGVVFILDYYLLDFGWYHFYAFPVGCFIGGYYKLVKNIINKLGMWCNPLVLLLIVLSLYYKIVLVDIIIDYSPSIVLECLADSVSVILSLSILILFNSFNKYYSRFLMFFGKYSYEIFLLHGVFLIKYNPILSLGRVEYTFIFFLFFILFLGWMWNKGIENLKYVTSQSILFLQGYLHVPSGRIK